MTTPAGWYDDGSGRQRWWDGTQWTEHFAPAADAADSGAEQTADSSVADASIVGASDAGASADADASVPESAAAAETAAAVESISAVESGAWEQPSTGAPAPSAEPAATDHAAHEHAAHEPAGSEPAAHEQSAPEQAAPADSTPAAAEPAEETVVAPESTPSWSAPSAADGADTSGYGTQPTTPFTAPGSAGPTAPVDGGAPPYAGAPVYPGAAASYHGSAPAPQPPQAPPYGGAPSYPGAAQQGYQGGAYPPAAPAYGAPGGYPYAAAPAAPAPLSIVGLIGLGAAALGTILSCIPFTFVFGWILLAAGFIVSLISVFLKGRKWPGIAGIVLSVVGTVIAVVMAFVFAISTVAGVVRDLPSAPPSSDYSTDDSDDGTSTPPEVVEGTLGEPITIEQYSGASEITVTSATWSTSDGSSIPSTNGGFVILDVTVTGLEGTSYVNPIYFAIETAEGAEGTYDFFADGQLSSEDLEAGDSISGKVTFDVAQSASYTVIVTDEMFQEVARITVTPTAG